VMARSDSPTMARWMRTSESPCPRRSSASMVSRQSRDSSSRGPATRARWRCSYAASDGRRARRSRWRLWRWGSGGGGGSSDGRRRSDGCGGGGRAEYGGRESDHPAPPPPLPSVRLQERRTKFNKPVISDSA
jgi:hypothetical protein